MSRLNDIYLRQHEQSKYIARKMLDTVPMKIGEHWLQEEGKLIKETVASVDSKSLGALALASAVAVSVFAPSAACVLISVMYTPENLGMLRSLVTAILLFLAAAVVASFASEILIIPCVFAIAKLIQDFKRDYKLAAEGKLDSSKVI